MASGRGAARLRRWLHRLKPQCPVNEDDIGRSLEIGFVFMGASSRLIRYETGTIRRIDDGSVLWWRDGSRMAEDRAWDSIVEVRRLN